MGKRSNFERKPRDFYPTPKEAVIPLLPHLPNPKNTWFWEPCAGEGHLLNILEEYGYTCGYASDIKEYKKLGIYEHDATSFRLMEEDYLHPNDFIITNPPWDRKILHPIIDNLRTQSPTWLLFDADWMHTKQAAPYLKSCSMIVSVGRVKWIPDSKHTGKDNCCWYKFENHENVITEFIGR